jgi:NAD(P)-dependent dehydrogenase (short-subunit alcohol dehydrogenase family)
MTDFSAVRDAAVRAADHLAGPSAATFARAFLATAAPEDVLTNPDRPKPPDGGGCARDEDCVGSDRARCDTRTRACVRCVTSAHCPAGNVCVNGVCATGCDAERPCGAGMACCAGACIDVQITPSHCGACGSACNATHGTPSCTAGRCAIVCDMGFADCDRDAANGCECRNTPTVDLPDENFVEQMNVKVLGYARCARAAVPYMKANGWGRIINISGLAARQTGNAIGSMRNVAVSALTKNLADELGPFGINVTCVHPGLIWTEFMEQQMQRQAEQRGETLEQAKERMAQGNTVQRIIQAEDIASVVAFLASPLSIAITGDSIAAGGGVGRAIHY